MERRKHALHLLAAPRRTLRHQAAREPLVDSFTSRCDVVAPVIDDPSCTSIRSTRPSRSNASCAAAMSIRTKLPSITRAGPLSSSSPRTM